MEKAVERKHDRHIGIIIQRIRAVIPAAHPCQGELKSLEFDLLFHAPEIVDAPENWRRLCRILSDELPHLDDTGYPEWAAKVGRIIRAEE